MERRQSARQPIRCRIDGVAGSQKFIAEGFDLSDHGVSFRTTQVLPLDTEVILHYRLEDDGPMITAKVRIVREADGRYGARFIERKSDGKAAK